MEQNDFLCMVETEKTFDQAVVSVLKAVEKRGWAIFGVYDLRERLAAKEFSQEPLKIVEFCNAKAADNMLSQNRLVSACMPCRIAVIQEKNGVILAFVRPSAMTQVFQGLDEQVAKTIEADVQQIVQDAK